MFGFGESAPVFTHIPEDGAHTASKTPYEYEYTVQLSHWISKILSQITIGNEPPLEMSHRKEQATAWSRGLEVSSPTATTSALTCSGILRIASGVRYLSDNGLARRGAVRRVRRAIKDGGTEVITECTRGRSQVAGGSG